MTKYKDWNIDGSVDLLVGGTPCQSFSVAGLRAGMADPRGNLALTFFAIAQQLGVRWVVWENVAGVLSSNGGRDFASFLYGLEECGFSWAYRVLDAQYFGVPQRRRRVFVVGYLGNWAAPSAVLFEPESLRGHTAPRRDTGQSSAVAPSGSFGDNSQTARCLTARGAGAATQDPTTDNLIAFHPTQDPISRSDNTTHAISAGSGKGQASIAIASDSAVRRLTAIECERLQGFPDNHTRIAWRGRPADQCPLGPRYKAIGNSMAVPVMRWIGERIQLVDDLLKEIEE